MWAMATAQGRLPVGSVLQKQQQSLPAGVSRLVLRWMSQKLQGKKDLFCERGGRGVRMNGSWRSPMTHLTS